MLQADYELSFIYSSLFKSQNRNHWTFNWIWHGSFQILLQRERALTHLFCIQGIHGGGEQNEVTLRKLTLSVPHTWIIILHIFLSFVAFIMTSCLWVHSWVVRMLTFQKQDLRFESHQGWFVKITSLWYQPGETYQHATLMGSAWNHTIFFPHCLVQLLFSCMQQSLGTDWKLTVIKFKYKIQQLQKYIYRDDQ